MITGFNTDIEHDGVTYHVQTEDKGLDAPIILSLVYSGGTILASKRSPYQDLIAEGFSDELLAERLKRQHRLICAAIHSGRIDDLKKMSGRAKGKQEVVVETSAAVTEEEVEEPLAELETAPSATVTCSMSAAPTRGRSRASSTPSAASRSSPPASPSISPSRVVSPSCYRIEAACGLRSTRPRRSARTSSSARSC